jgi:hypothetical protein
MGSTRRKSATVFARKDKSSLLHVRDYYYAIRFAEDAPWDALIAGSHDFVENCGRSGKPLGVGLGRNGQQRKGEQRDDRNEFT